MYVHKVGWGGGGRFYSLCALVCNYNAKLHVNTDLYVFSQIERQLQTYLQRVEAILGKGWESHVEGQKLKQDGDSFRQKLNTQQLFEDWKKKVLSLSRVCRGTVSARAANMRVGRSHLLWSHTKYIM